jgi:uroporphyrinogen decarboxylase
MIHRERILKAILHQPTDTIPTDMWATQEVQEKLCAHFGIKDGKGEMTAGIGMCGGSLSRGIAGILKLWDLLDIDGIFDVRPPYVGKPKNDVNGILVNEWGIGYARKDYATGSYLEQAVFPLKGMTTIDELDSFPWPDPDDYDYSKLPGIIAQCGGRAICCGYSAVFTYHNSLRGLEQSLIDPIVDPDFTRHLINRLSDFFAEYHKRCFEAAPGLIDITQVTDDWGSQSGLMTSPEIFFDFYSAPMNRAVELAHAYHVKAFHHDDGDCRKLIPAIMDMGIDILNPIQWRCGDWDLAQLKSDYGKRVCFHSAVDNQETLPLGTPEDVRREVRMLKRTLSSDGTGFIIGPCHNFQPNTSVENIVALYETAREPL